jgi:hypothetical protein
MSEDLTQETNALVMSRFVAVFRRDDCLLFSYERSRIDHLGLRLREKEVRLMIKSKLKRLGPVLMGTDPRSLAMTPLEGSEDGIKDVLSKIDQNLEAMANRPLTHRLVEQVLDITEHERRRWTKDGRLPQSGYATFRKGREIFIALYSVKKISQLLATPEVIAAWREADSKKGF